jgi:hypothetical protein
MFLRDSAERLVSSVKASVGLSDREGVVNLTLGQSQNGRAHD